MKIKELWFKNNRHKWELEKTAFSDLTLLVGASGVGKTQTLNTIMKLIRISMGNALNGVEWDFHFTVDNGENFRWTGEFENLKETEQLEFTGSDFSSIGNILPIPKILKEELYMGDELIFKRKESNLEYKEIEIPKISPFSSVLSFFRPEEISSVRKSFLKIAQINYSHEQVGFINANIIADLSKIIREAQSEMSKNGNFANNFPVKTIRDINVLLMLKFFLVWQLDKEVFQELINEFKDIFPQVEDVRFEILQKQEVYELQIKERGTDWISRNEISSGMFKTLMHIAEMKLLADGSVVLIDEFENSLGVNCIDAVADGLINPGRDIQYIITSHHPYIINNIDMKYWKVVMRKGAKVFTKNAEQLKLGKSKHEAFKQLLNLEEFAEGIS